MTRPSNVPMRQVDIILERFPGPVTLYVSRRRKLAGLALCVAVAAFFAWLLFTGDVARTPRSAWYDTVMAWITLAVCGVFAVRAVILLLVPAAASLTLDADGFETAHVFHRRRLPWRNVSDFRVETTVWRGRIGGPLTRIMYQARGAGGPGAKPTIRVLPEIYGLPRDDFATLMNEWRKRALMHAPETGVPMVCRTRIGS